MTDRNPIWLPLYGCLTGIELPIERLELVPGITLRRVFVDMFGASMLAFASPATRSSPHPAPWVAVRGGYTFESRVEVAISDISSLAELSPTVVAWLIAALFRLQIDTPVRMAVLGSMPFDEMGERWKEASPVAFEQAVQQIGAFRDHRVEATLDDLRWLSEMLPVAASLYHEERFLRAVSVYDQSQWSPTLEMGAVLVWTALETLFDLGGEREKTKAISRAVSDYVGVDRRDRDRAYQVVQDLYAKRGRVVHVGRTMDPKDAIQSYQFAKVAFRRVLIDGVLPAPPSGGG